MADTHEVCARSSRLAVFAWVWPGHRRKTFPQAKARRGGPHCRGCVHHCTQKKRKTRTETPLLPPPGTARSCLAVQIELPPHNGLSPAPDPEGRTAPSARAEHSRRQKLPHLSRFSARAREPLQWGSLSFFSQLLDRQDAPARAAQCGAGCALASASCALALALPRIQKPAKWRHRSSQGLGVCWVRRAPQSPH